MYRRIACTLLWAVGFVVSAQVLVDPEQLLERIRQKAQANLMRLPDYICIQTVVRERRPRPEAAFQPVDTIRLQVGLVGEQELFAWPDSARLEQDDISELVQHGAIGNGSFALHARNVFLSRGPDFEFRGEETLGGRRAYRYDFAVPYERSTYRLRVRPYEARVPFHGAFWADPESLDLMRLQVDADEIPVELGLAGSSEVIDYRRFKIGAGDFLLPASGELSMLGMRGDATRNRTTFGEYRQYVSESSISFNAPTAEFPAAAKEEEPGRRLPRGTELELALRTPIDPRTAVLGDAVQAILTRPVRDGPNVLVPDGAVVRGRLVRLEHYRNPIDHHVVGLEFNTLETGGAEAQFTATMQKAGPHPGLIGESRGLNPSFDRRNRGPSMQILVNEIQTGCGILHWKASSGAIEKGLKMRWKLEP